MRDELILVGIAIVAIILGTGLFFFGSFNTDEQGSDNLIENASSENLAAAVVPFAKIARGTHSIVTARVNYAITSSEELNNLWKMLDATSTPPVVDFSKNQIIAVFAGEQPNGGYSIEVSKVEDSNERIVTVTIAKPGSDCVSAQVLTAPYELITVPVTQLPLTHRDSTKIIECSR